MLTSSDAKFRCLWHMFTWSIMLTLVSQFYILTDHIAFYIFGSLCIIVLPFVTSLYSTTGGRRGSSLLRVAYVLCDPVLACMSVVPVLLLNRLTPLIHEMECLGVNIKSWNETLSCLGNKSTSNLDFLINEGNIPFSRKPWMWLEKKNLLTAIQASIVIPCVLALFMGRRSRKMSYTTALTTFTYWLIASIECVSIVEVTLLCGYSRVHFAVTTQVTVCVACVVANSYAVVTLCSYLSPMAGKGDKSSVCARFDVIYKSIVGVTGVVFVEIPQLVARFQMLASTSDWSGEEVEFRSSEFFGLRENASVFRDAAGGLGSAFDPNDVYDAFPTSFYAWAFKDGIMIGVIVSALVLQKFGKSPPILLRILGEGKNCAGVAFDNPGTFFVPEKRDKYIVTHCGKLQDPAFRDGAPRHQSYPDRMISQDSVEESCFFLPRRTNKMSLLTAIKSHKKQKKESGTSIDGGVTDRFEEVERDPCLPLVVPYPGSLDAKGNGTSGSPRTTGEDESRVPSKVVPPDPANSDKRRKKSVKFSFSEDHIINSKAEPSVSLAKHPFKDAHTAGSILVNYSNRNCQSFDASERDDSTDHLLRNAGKKSSPDVPKAAVEQMKVDLNPPGADHEDNSAAITKHAGRSS